MNFSQKLSCFASLLIIFGFNSCTKDNGDQVPPISIMVVNTSPNTALADVNFYRGSLVSTLSLPFGNTGTYQSLSTATYQVTAGSSGGAQPAANTSLDFVSNRAYSLFVVDSLSRLKLAVTNDDLSIPLPLRAKVRFFNFSPDATSLSLLFVNATDTIAIANRTFNDQSTNRTLTNFASLITNVYDLYLFSNNRQVYTMPGVNFQNGKIFTIITKGTVNGTPAQSISLQVINNN